MPAWQRGSRSITKDEQELRDRKSRANIIGYQMNESKRMKL
jgi:hypothetical protein